jgi:hypothetical protein
VFKCILVSLDIIFCENCIEISVGGSVALVLDCDMCCLFGVAVRHVLFVWCCSATCAVCYCNYTLN